MIFQSEIDHGFSVAMTIFFTYTIYPMQRLV